MLTGVRPDHTIAREEVFGPVLSVIEVGDARRGRRGRQRIRVRAVGRGLHARHQRRAAARRPHRHGHRVRERTDDRRRDPAAVRRHQAHRQRVPRGRHPRHRAVQPGQDGVRRLLGPAAEGPDRQPPRAWESRDDDPRHAVPAKDVQPRAGSSGTRRRWPPCCRASPTSSPVEGRGLVAHRRRRTALARLRRRASASRTSVTATRASSRPSRRSSAR